MVTSKQCFDKYGDPNLLSTQNKHFTLWEVDSDIRESLKHVRFSQLGTIGFPKKIFLNKDFQPVLEKALRNVINKGLSKELKTWDGVFIIRTKRALTSMSLHSWAIACDLNAFENQLNQKPNLSNAFVQCFKEAGCDWGGDWKRLDGMHFQLSSLNIKTVGITTDVKSYTIVSGDTLTKIAIKLNTTVTYLETKNNLKSDSLKIGQILRY